MTKESLESLILKEWPTPNTYSNRYEMPPKSAGVYVFFAHKHGLSLDSYLVPEYECIYVGSSLNLYSRYGGHELRRNDSYWWLGFFFMESDNYYNDEIALIKILKPTLNVQHNG